MIEGATMHASGLFLRCTEKEKREEQKSGEGSFKMNKPCTEDLDACEASPPAPPSMDADPPMDPSGPTERSPRVDLESPNGLFMPLSAVVPPPPCIVSFPPPISIAEGTALFPPSKPCNFEFAFSCPSNFSRELTVGSSNDLGKISVTSFPDASNI